MAEVLVENKILSAEAKKIREQWLHAVERLVTDISCWLSEEKGWSVCQESKEIREEPLGSYTVPVLRLVFGENELVLEPIARMIRGGEGRIDLYAWPALYRVRLIGEEDGVSWIVLTDSGIPLHQQWEKSSFLQLINDLLNAG